MSVNAEENNNRECFFKLYDGECISKEKYLKVFGPGYDQELLDMWDNLYNKKVKLTLKELERLRVIAENASILDFPELSYTVAVVYMNIPDHKNAELHMQRAMDLEHPMAWHNTGWWYDYGFGHIKIDKKKAAELYKTAFWKFKYARSGARLAQMYLWEEIKLSENISDKHKEAKKILLKISDKPKGFYIEENDLVMANYNLGRMYRYATGVNVDLEKSFSYFQFAADRGHILAKHNLAQLLRIKSP